MSRPKHTPGPWVIAKTRGSRPDRDIWIGGDVGPAGMVQEVAEIFTHHDHGKANARLIAAAPEMLDLLKAIAVEATPERSECGFCGHPGTSSKDDNSDWEETHEEDCTLLEIRRLISKAEGKK